MHNIINKPILQIKLICLLSPLHKKTNVSPQQLCIFTPFAI